MRRVVTLLNDYRLDIVSRDELFDRTLAASSCPPQAGEGARLIALIDDHWRELIDKRELLARALGG